MSKRRKRRQRERRAKRQQAQQQKPMTLGVEPGVDASRPDEAMLAERRLEEAEVDIEQLDAVVEEQVALVVTQAEAIEISSQETYEAAAEFLTTTLKPALREIEDTFGPIVKAAHGAWQAALQQRKRHEQPLLDAEEIVKNAMGAYHQEQERIAAEAEAERLEAARQEAERQAVEEAARLESDGHKAAAEERLEQPVTPVVTAPPAPPPPKAAGTAVRTKPDYRIVDESKIDRAFLKIDKAKIRSVVNSMGADAEKVVGGIEVFEKPVVAARAR